MDVDIGAKIDPWGTPFLSLRSLLCCPSLVLSTKLRFEISSTMNFTLCLSGSKRGSFRINPRCRTGSYAAVRSTRTVPAVSLASNSTRCPVLVERPGLRLIVLYGNQLAREAIWGSTMGLIRPWIILSSSLMAYTTVR